MITNMRIETSDEDRRLLAVYLERDSATKRLATRNDIKDIVTTTSTIAAEKVFIVVSLTEHTGENNVFDLLKK